MLCHSRGELLVGHLAAKRKLKFVIPFDAGEFDVDAIQEVVVELSSIRIDGRLWQSMDILVNSQTRMIWSQLTQIHSQGAGNK